MRNKFKFLLDGSLIYPGKNISVGFCTVVGNCTWESWISLPIIPHSCLSVDSEMDMLSCSESILKSDASFCHINFILCLLIE